MNDPIVEEVRKYGEQFVARYNNDISKICEALKSKEKELNIKIVNRPPHFIQKQTAN